MPSAMHEALAQLFRNRPTLAPELLERALGVSIPAFAEATIQDGTFADLRPAEYRADLVVLLGGDSPVLGIIVEVQLSKDPEKLLSWPVYAVGLRARFGCPTCVLVVTISEEVAAWARETIAIGPGSVFTPLVMGPAAVPVVVSVEDATRDPQLAVLSILAHGRDEDAAAMLPAAVQAVRTMDAVDPGHAELYFELVARALQPAIRRAFEDLMKIQLDDYEWKSDYGRRLHAEGIAKGIAEGKAASVLLVLRARGIAVDASAEATIRASADLAELDRWLVRAAKVDTVDALFV